MLAWLLRETKVGTKRINTLRWSRIGLAAGA
jgi:hypothetical protein